MGSEKRGKTETRRESFETLIKEKAKEWEALGDPLATKIMTQGLKFFFSLNSNKGAYETKTNQLKLAKDELLAVFYSTTLVIYDELNIIINSIAT